MTDKLFLKDLIVQLRNQGISFQEISNKLSEEYNIKRSRQAICGMYNRAISENSDTQNIEEIHDMVHYNAIGISCDRIAEILKSDSDSDEISAYKVKSILKDNKDRLDSIVNRIEEQTYEMIKDGMTKEYIIDSLGYKGEKPTKAAMTKFIQKGTVRLLNESKVEILGKILNQTQDKELIKVIISLDKDISYKDVAKEARKRRV